MQATRFLAVLAVLGAAQAQEALTRDQVRTELAAARRSGDIQAPGDSGLTLRDLHPDRYPARGVAVSKTRAQVVAEFKDAERNGDLPYGDTGVSAREVHPQNSKQVVASLASTPR
jgi:hypothetical protein